MHFGEGHVPLGKPTSPVGLPDGRDILEFLLKKNKRKYII